MPLTEIPERSAGPGRSTGPCWAIWLVILASLVARPTHGRDPEEYQLKAAFLVSFARFIEWPPGRFADRAVPFFICVVGQDPFGAQLEAAVRGHEIGKHPIAIQRFGGAGASLRDCPVVFVSLAQRQYVPEIVSRIGDACVLTVGDSEDFILRGGAIRFFAREGKVRFEINLDVTDRAGLKISSKVLALARVRGGRGHPRE